jgi:hypothetical protein
MDLGLDHNLMRIIAQLDQQILALVPPIIAHHIVHLDQQGFQAIALQADHRIRRSLRIAPHAQRSAHLGLLQPQPEIQFHLRHQPSRRAIILAQNDSRRGGLS